MKIAARVSITYHAYGQFRTNKLKTGGWEYCYIDQSYHLRSDARKAVAVLKRGGCKDACVIQEVEWSGHEVRRKRVK